ncbi:MAG: universal stress protein [Archangiaceae bacterium]|nr:universal stress protein [Archangiaceae bacterium]
MIKISRILLPVDFSPPAETALEYAMVLANSLGASITLLHIMQVPNGMVGIVPGATIDGDVVAATDLARERLASLAAPLRARGFDRVDEQLVTNVATIQGILDHARTGDYQLIVMATHGRTGAARLLMGSVTEQVLRNATCPVLTVHVRPTDE